VKFNPATSAVAKPPAAGIRVVDDFEAATINWMPWVGNNNNPPQFTRKWVAPGKVGKQAMRIDYDLGPMPQWAGVTYHSPKDDWSKYRCLHFWFYGGRSSNTFSFNVYTDNGSLQFPVKDDFSGWREFCPPFTEFQGADGLDITQPAHRRAVSKLIVITNSAGKGSYQVDQLELLEHEILR
jgi:hypothetical protein